MSWRLEPNPRAAGIEEGLAARIHDPLWLLARQWQMGEFYAKDAGTPSLVRAIGSCTQINAWRGAAQTSWQPFDPGAGPLDALVEAETRTAPTLRERIESGVQFLRQLDAAGLSAYAAAFVAAHAFSTADLADAAFAADALLAAVARRQPDGAALPATLNTMLAGQPAAVTIAAADLDTFGAAAKAWLAWYAEEIAPVPGIGTAATWQENRLEYGFAVSSGAAGGSVLRADAYRGDGIDWYDFDIDAGATAAPGAAPLAIDRSAVPMPVRYGGMPLPRFWAMEDARYDYGSVDASAGDIGRLLLVEFATVYGNDWFVLPMKLPASSLTVLDSVVVTDTFGRALSLARAGDSDPQWNLYSLDVLDGQPAHAAQRGLLLPPAVGAVLESSSVETVQFLRDEMADLAFGVERGIEDGLGRRIDRRAAWSAPAPPARNVNALPAYRVETIVPDYWIPLAPERLDGQQSVHLRLVPLETDLGGTPRLAMPRGRILTAADPAERLWVYEQDVPREGTRVDRLRRYARWHQGRTSVWTARRRAVGRGEGSSGLRFDAIVPPGT